MINVFLLEGQWKSQKVCYFYIFSGRFTIICLKKVFLNTDFYVVYNIYHAVKNGREYIRDLFSLLQLNLLLNGKTFILQYLFKLYVILSLLSGRIHEHLKKYIVFSAYVLYMSNNFPTFSRISLKILSILVYIVLSMKSLGLDVIHFRIFTIVRLRFSNVLGRFFRLKIVSLLDFCRENQSGQLRFRAGWMQKTSPL